MIGELKFAAADAVTGTSGSIMDEKGFRVNDAVLSSITEISLTEIHEDATLERDGVEIMDLLPFLEENGIFEGMFDPSVKDHRIRVGSAILAWLRRVRFPNAHKILHVGDTSRVDSGQVDGECTVRDTGDPTLRGAHYAAHLDKHLPGIGDCFAQKPDAEAGARIFAEKYAALNGDVWAKASISKRDVQHTVLEKPTGMVLNFPGGFTDSLSLFKKRAGRQATCEKSPLLLGFGSKDKIVPAKRRARSVVRSPDPKLPKAERSTTIVKRVGPEGVGKRVRVYFDLDDAWYFGRIERYKKDRATGKDLHQVVYPVDGQVEWLCLADVRCMYSDRVGVAKYSKYPYCPAEIFQVATGFDEDLIQLRKNKVFAYFWNPSKKKKKKTSKNGGDDDAGGVVSRSWAAPKGWVSRSNVANLEAVRLKKPYASLLSVAEEERDVRTKLYLPTLRGADLIGYGVALRFEALFTSRTKKAGQDLLRGEVRAYDRLSGMNFICFDDIDIRPKWVDLRTVVPSTVYELSKKKHNEILESSSPSRCPPNVDSVCALCDRKKNFYAFSTTVTGRPVRDEEAAACCVCSRCRRTFHEICAIRSNRRSAASRLSSWLCHDCHQCNGCGAFTSDLNGRFVVDYKMSRPEAYDEVAEYLPLEGSAGVTLCTACEASYDRLEYCTVCLKSWSFDEGSTKDDASDDNGETSGEKDGSYRRCEDFMIQCDKCDMWCHAACDLAIPNIDAYRRFTASTTSPTSMYVCPMCRFAHMGRTLNALKLLDRKYLFREPVTEDIAPGYFDVVSSPMDLLTMRENIKGQIYRSTSEFRSDFALICFNALTYNHYGTGPYRAALAFYADGLRLLTDYLPDSE
eukprot:g2746.t1